MNCATNEFSQESVEPFWFEDPKRHEDAMREAMEPVMLRGMEGQYFSGLHFNRDFRGRPLIAIVGAFLAEATAPARKYEGYQYAAAFPENPVQLIDLPAHGLSDPFSVKQRAEVFRSRSMELVAISQAEALRSRHQDAKEIIAVGTSIGGLVVPDLVVAAGALDLNPRALVSHEMVGLDKRPVLGLMKAFYWHEWRYQRHYNANPKGASLEQGFEETFMAELRRCGYKDGDYKQYGLYGRDPLGVAVNIFHSPFTSGEGVDVLKNALDTHADLTGALVTGALSWVNRWQKIAPGVEKILDDYGDRLSWDLWPFDSHNIGLPTQAPRLAAFTKAKIGHLAASPTSA